MTTTSRSWRHCLPAEASQALAAFVRAGATVEVHFDDGLTTSPWPVAWARLRGRWFEYLEAAENRRLHVIALTAAPEHDDADIILRSHGYTLILSSIWNPDHERILKTWAELLADGTWALDADMLTTGWRHGDLVPELA